jgi:hypothetical protein
MEELESGDNDEHANNDDFGPSTTDKLEIIKPRNTLNISAGHICLELEAVMKDQPPISCLAFNQHSPAGNLAMALMSSQVDDKTELEDIQGLNKRVEAMQARLLSTIEQAKEMRQKQRKPFSSTVVSPSPVLRSP